MGYRIEYDSRIDKYEVTEDHSLRFPMLVLGAFFLFAVLTYHFWPEGSTRLRAILIPGEDAVTVQAFHNMTDDLRSGAGVAEALYAFCRYLIHGT